MVAYKRLATFSRVGRASDMAKGCLAHEGNRPGGFYKKAGAGVSLLSLFLFLLDLRLGKRHKDLRPAEGGIGHG